MTPEGETADCVGGKEGSPLWLMTGRPAVGVGLIWYIYLTVRTGLRRVFLGRRRRRNFRLGLLLLIWVQVTVQKPTYINSNCFHCTHHIQTSFIKIPTCSTPCLHITSTPRSRNICVKLWCRWVGGVYSTSWVGGGSFSHSLPTHRIRL